MKKNNLIKKGLIFGILLLFLLSGTMPSIISIKEDKSLDNLDVFQIKKSNLSPYKLFTQNIQIIKNPCQYLNFGSGPAFDGPGNQIHPALGRTDDGIILASFRDDNLDEIVWTYSDDDGITWGDGFYWPYSGDYPSIKLRNDTTFYGTFVTDFLDMNGGATYLFQTYDPTQLSDPSITNWFYDDWSSYGWSDMIDADIACDSSQQDFEWGVSSYVISTTYGDGYTDGPTIVYSDESTQGSRWIGWYYYDNCDHTDVDIDHSTIYSYVVYDWEDTTSGYYKLLVRVNDFEEIMNGYDEMFELDYGYNLQYPAVAAGNGNIIILAETDENSNKDIICFYGSDLNSMSASFVVNTDDDERFPDIRHMSDSSFIATYVKNGNLYAIETIDGGATWIESSWQINDNENLVVEEYKTSDLCENAVKVLWEETHSDIDCYYNSVSSVSSPDLDCSGDLDWIDVNPGDTVTGTITVENDGEPASLLDWEIHSYPTEWGEWSFDPDSGINLLEGESIDIDVEVIAPDEEEQTFTGEVVLVNSENASDTCTIDVSLATPQGQIQPYQAIPRFIQNNPKLFPILQRLLGL